MWGCADTSQTQQAIRRCAFQVYFAVGHVPFPELPDPFAADLLRFVDMMV